MSKVSDFTTVTELPGQKASQEQLARLYQRYKFASQFCESKDVLEVACGAGIGLGLLAQKAKQVTGVDIDSDNLSRAANYYRPRKNIEVKKMDALNILFKDNSFDIVILFEAIYYLDSAEQFIKEAHRALRPGGILILGAVNKDWADFNPSPYSIKYYSLQELNCLLGRFFAKVTAYAAFPAQAKTAKDTLLSFMKRIAVFLGLIPKTMNGKGFLKRVFYGKLFVLPNEIKDSAIEYIPPETIRIDNHMSSGHKVLYALAYK